MRGPPQKDGYDVIGREGEEEEDVEAFLAAAGEEEEEEVAPTNVASKKVTCG